MPTCRHCGNEHASDELVRHEEYGVLLVHCPDCSCLMGHYRRHGDAPRTDRLREQRG